LKFWSGAIVHLSQSKNNNHYNNKNKQKTKKTTAMIVLKATVAVFKSLESPVRMGGLPKKLANQ
jgi:hypothetical protein